MPTSLTTYCKYLCSLLSFLIILLFLYCLKSIVHSLVYHMLPKQIICFKRTRSSSCSALQPQHHNRVSSTVLNQYLWNEQMDAAYCLKVLLDNPAIRFDSIDAQMFPGQCGQFVVIVLVINTLQEMAHHFYHNFLFLPPYIPSHLYNVRIILPAFTTL